MRLIEEKFADPTAHGFFRIAACTPRVALAEPEANAKEIASLAAESAARGASLIVFPELGLSGYSNDDLFFQDALLDTVEQATEVLLRQTENLPSIIVVGAPLVTDEGLFNCAIVFSGGKLLCAYPKSYLPNYREFYERRYFRAATNTVRQTIRILEIDVPFGTEMIVTAPAIPGFAMHVELCEDLWVPIPPSTLAACAGASVLVNLSASNASVGKDEYRRLLVTSQSGRCIATCVYCGAGHGESTTDLAWDGQAIICENSDMLAESGRFNRDSSVLIADTDLERLRQDRARMNSFGDCAARHASSLPMRRIEIALDRPASSGRLQRRVERFPFVPSGSHALNERCTDVCNIQIQGLARRLEATGIQKAVIGVSGGVDSAHALIIAVRAFDVLDLPRNNILACDMPGFATSPGPRNNARVLMESLGVSQISIDIGTSAMQMLRDIGHPYAKGEKVYDATFENVQAGARTSLLFRLANLHNALVVGTSDLSELALGYTTYGVGDQMSHYAVNASVPKTLIRYLLSWSVCDGGLGPATNAALKAILETASSPELVPATNNRDMQSAEEQIGPYALHDFFLYYIARFGFRPSKVAYLAHQAWSDTSLGSWPDMIPESERVAYDLSAIKMWLAEFLRRFFANQFKRSAMPNGPKIGSGGCLSPRGDWRAPSDASATTWLDELAREVP